MASNEANTKIVLSTVASVAASAMLFRSIAIDIIPHEIRSFFFSGLAGLHRRFSSKLTIIMEEFDGHSPNKVFEAANAYLGTKASASVERLQVSKTEEEKKIAIAIDRGEEIVDIFDNIKLHWRFICTTSESSGKRYPHDPNVTLQSETRSYELSFHKKHKEKVLNSYLPYIVKRAEDIKEERKVIKLHTVDYNCWDSRSINLDHPMNFTTLALDQELKKTVTDDLNTFMKGKEFYKRVGKAWKRGYLLYGPPGTGKSSLIAAMANHLNYDIYDLDLTDVQSNSQLRMLLLGMSSRSILVIEDIDCSIDLQNREREDEPVNYDQNMVTLSGLLNFIDGLWSCCGEERIIVVTTNHKDRLDPALLRPGRMDMHIHMSHCTISAFKQLALNYLGITHHDLFEEIEGLVGEVPVTPAEVAGELMKSPDANLSLQGLISLLQRKKAELDKPQTNEQSEAQEEKEERRRPSTTGRTRGSIRRF